MEERIGFLPCFFSPETLKKQIIYTILKKQGTENQIIRLSDNLMKKSSLHFSNTGV